MRSKELGKYRKISFWWEDGLFFKCLGCGRCCRGEPGAIWLARGETERISSFLGLAEDDFQKKFITSKWKYTGIREKKNGDCVFYSREKGCLIYPARPLQCSLYPFWKSLLRSEKRWNEESKYCPGMNQGDFYSPDMIRRFIEMSEEVCLDL